MRVLEIEGMSCPRCLDHARRALEAVPGVTAVELSLQPGRARVEGSVEPEALVAALAEAGYRALPLD